MARRGTIVRGDSRETSRRPRGGHETAHRGPARVCALPLTAQRTRGRERRSFSTDGVHGVGCKRLSAQTDMWPRLARRTCGWMIARGDTWDTLARGALRPATLVCVGALRKRRRGVRYVLARARGRCIPCLGRPALEPCCPARRRAEVSVAQPASLSWRRSGLKRGVLATSQHTRSCLNTPRGVRVRRPRAAAPRRGAPAHTSSSRSSGSSTRPRTRARALARMQAKTHGRARVIGRVIGRVIAKARFNRAAAARLPRGSHQAPVTIL